MDVRLQWNLHILMEMLGLFGAEKASVEVSRLN